MTNDRTLSISTVTHIINAPLEKVDIADWLFNLPDAEYQLCSHAHIAAGQSISDDKHPVSINVETISEALMVQHFCTYPGVSPLPLGLDLRRHHHERTY
jgi:hypothetical protein